jgi:uncharacterized protein (DUF1810 family)
VSSYDFSHFLDAQDGVYDQALAELGAGRKTSHWMWFIYPQLRDLGSSSTSRRFGLADVAEARAFLAHPVLGPRLRRASEVAAGVPRGSASEIFGSIDALKLRSCATLFLRAAPEEPVFPQVLQRYFDGRPDPRTDALLDTAGA